MVKKIQHADPVFDAERIARHGIDRLEEYLSEPATATDDDDGEKLRAARLEKARLGHKALSSYSHLRSVRQREITGAFAIGKEIGAPREAMAPLFEALTGQAVAQLLPRASEQSGGGAGEPAATD